MTKLYRGLLEILVKMCLQQIELLKTHIQSHNTGQTSSEFDLGVAGFWNYMLEITFTLFSILFLFIFVSITAVLAVCSYPPAAFINYGAWLLKNTKNPPQENPIIIRQANVQEKEK
jgi:hypothetical protein